MIDIGSIAGLLEHNHGLDAYCAACDRWAVFDLAAMVAAGLGDRRLPIAVRFSRYGKALSRARSGRLCGQSDQHGDSVLIGESPGRSDGTLSMIS